MEDEMEALGAFKGSIRILGYYQEWRIKWKRKWKPGVCTGLEGLGFPKIRGIPFRGSL